MKKLISLLVLLPSLVLAQGLANGPPWGSGGSTLASFPLSTSGALITEDANTVAHVYWNGTALVDTKGNAWAMAGTVPQVTANPFTTTRYGAGPFSAANYYSLGTGTDVLDITGDMTGCIVTRLPDTGSGYKALLLNGSLGSSSGWAVEMTSDTGYFKFSTYGAATSTTGSTSNPVASTGKVVLVGCFGRNGDNQYAKANLTGTVTNAGTKQVAGSGIVANIGGLFDGTMYEVYITTSPFVEATVVEIIQKVLGHFDGSAPLAVARGTQATYENPAGTIWTVPANVGRITTDGLLVEIARTNYALQSNSMSTGTAATSPWAGTGINTTVTTVAGAPMGGTWVEITVNGSLSQNYYQGIGTLPSTTTLVASAWAMHPTATGTAYVGFVCPAANNAATCSCLSSDGRTVTPVRATVNCTCDFATDTTPVRISAIGTCTSAFTTGAYIQMDTGSLGNTTNGVVRFSGAQVEIGTFPSSLIVTTTTATARNSDSISATVPAVPSKWCVAVTGTPTTKPWTDVSSIALWSLGPNVTSANTAYGTSIVLYSLDATSTLKTFTLASQPTAASHRFVHCNNAGTLSLAWDGVEQTGTVAGTGGTGLFGTAPTQLNFASAGASGYANGVPIKNLKICAAKNAKECK